jgi:hypothetical protein
MRISKKTVKLLVFIALFLGTLTLSLTLYKFSVNHSPFLVTALPKGTYTVKLTGQKERPYFFTNEVHFHVFKNEKTFLNDKYLHSGDAFDLSFESGYPNYQWLDENILHFYNEKNFIADKPDNLIVVNKTDKVIKYLRIYSQDKFLLFDIQPGSETKIPVTNFSSEYLWVDVEGENDEGRNIGNSVNLSKNKTNYPFTVYIYINNDSLIIESS